MPDKILAQVQRLGTENTPRLFVEHIPLPKPASHELLVKVSHAGQNPTDGKSLACIAGRQSPSNWSQCNLSIPMLSGTEQFWAVTLSAPLRTLGGGDKSSKRHQT